MKHKWLKIATMLLLIGIIGLTYMGSVQAKVNINSMTAADWQDSHITDIGVATQTKLMVNAPYSDIKNTAKIMGVGTRKQAQIERHFSTYDTCRIEIYLAYVVSSCVLIVIGTLIIIYIFIRRKTTAETLTELIKR